MIARIFIALFYAAFFFALGAWSGGHLKPIGTALSRAAISSQEGAERLWSWAIGNPQPKPKQVPVAATPEDEPETPETSGARLAAARDSFARGDLQGAIAIYKSYLSTHPDDADALGEIGNVYFNTGQVEEAAISFHAAALQLIDEGLANRARALEPAIRVGAPALADDLNRRLAAAE